jgi:hypothetical protein
MIILDNLNYNWTAKVELNNGIVVTISYTAYPKLKHIIKNVLSVEADYPKVGIKK